LRALADLCGLAALYRRRGSLWRATRQHDHLWPAPLLLTLLLRALRRALLLRPGLRALLVTRLLRSPARVRSQIRLR
jgi:hypothetical protein